MNTICNTLSSACKLKSSFGFLYVNLDINKLTRISRYTICVAKKVPKTHRSHLFRGNCTNDRRFGITTKSRLKYASKFAITIWNMPPVTTFQTCQSYAGFLDEHIIYHFSKINEATTSLIVMYLCFPPSLSLLITLPRTIKLLLICFPSFKRIPPAPVLAMRSEPAKSTKFWANEKNKIKKWLYLKVIQSASSLKPYPIYLDQTKKESVSLQA